MWGGVELAESGYGNGTAAKAQAHPAQVEKRDTGSCLGDWIVRVLTVACVLGFVYGLVTLVRETLASLSLEGLIFE